MTLWTLTAILPGHNQELQMEMLLPKWDIRRVERCGLVNRHASRISKSFRLNKLNPSGEAMP